MDKKKIIYRILFLVVILYFFLLGIKLMGGSFKLFGKDFAKVVLNSTTNPFVGLFIGILATSLVQSSSVTTSVLVGLTASGALSIGGAIPIIMGANIGTSITNTIVSLGYITKKKEFRNAFEVATVHDFFNLIIVAILFPIEMYFKFLERASIYLTHFFLGSNVNTHFSSPLNYIIKPVASAIEGILVNNALMILVLSLIIIFYSLHLFVKVARPLAESEFKHLLNKHIFSSPARSFGLGLFLTIFVQSSSVTTSIAVPLAGIGIITLDTIFPYILGANIGTTFTALLASLVTGSSAAVTVALEHVLFNTFGSAIIYPIRKLPIALSKGLASLSFKSKFYPIAYVIFAYYIIPSFVIFLFH